MIPMRRPHTSIHLLVQIYICVLALIGTAVASRAQTTPDFSGRRKQDNDRCQPKRSGDVTLHIEHHDPGLTLETTLSNGPQNVRHAVQKYTTDGRVSRSIGTDGDAFYTSVIWKDSSLFLSIEEHEDGRLIRSKETWSLIENGATLERTRERPDGTKQILFYGRQFEGAHAGEQ